MTPLEIFAVLMSVMGVAFTIQRNILCWGFNIVACALYAYLFFEFKLYGETLLQGIFIFMVCTIGGQIISRVMKSRSYLLPGSW